jgi:hypothetical protein
LLSRLTVFPIAAGVKCEAPDTPRVGDYRLICKIERRVMTVAVLHVGHRSKIYD